MSEALPAAPLPRRLDAYLAAAGITEGVAMIDGAPATASQLVYPGEVVAVDGTIIARTERPSRVHAYHKVAGEKIEDIRPAGCEGLSHVGQLDKKTTGLLLFTDDFELSRLILCPGLLPKTYVVEIDAPRVSEGLTDEQLAALTEKKPLPQNATERRKGRNERGTPVGFESVTPKGSRPIGDATRPAGCAPKSRFAFEVVREEEQARRLLVQLADVTQARAPRRSDVLDLLAGYLVVGVDAARPLGAGDRHAVDGDDLARVDEL